MYSPELLIIQKDIDSPAGVRHRIVLWKAVVDRKNKLSEINVRICIPNNWQQNAMVVVTWAIPIRRIQFQ